MKKFLPFKKFCMQSDIYALLLHYFDMDFCGHPREFVECLNFLFERLTADLRRLFDGNDPMNVFSIESLDRFYSKRFLYVLLIAAREVATSRVVRY